MVSISGSGLELVPVNKTASFNINTKGAGGGEVKVDVTSPTKQRLPISLTQSEDGIHNVQFTPKQTGDHIVHVTNYSLDVKGSPFVCKVYDVDKVTVTDMPTSSVPGQSIEFGIDASRAGPGNLEIQVNGGRIPCSVKNLGGHKFSASFMPADTNAHVVQMCFNKIPVSGSPWEIGILDSSSFTIQQQDGSEFVHVKECARFNLLGPSSSLSNVEITITDPSGTVVNHTISTETENQHKLEFTPKVVGIHKVHTSYKGEKLNECPLTCKVYDPLAIILSDIPKLGLVGRKENFTLDASMSGDGSLRIQINNGELENKVEKKSHGIYCVSFVPTKIGSLQIELTFNKRPIEGSPFLCNVVDATEVEVLNLADVVRCNTLAVFTVHPSAGIMSNKQLEVNITSPSGRNVPARVTGSPRIGFQAEYTPAEVGVYVVSVKFGGVSIKKSPFQVKSYDASLVKVSDIPQGIVGVPCKFKVDTASAGEGNLQVDIFAGGKTVPHHVKQLNTSCYEVTLVAQSAIMHQVHLKYNTDCIPGSPYIINYLDAAEISASGDGLGLVSCHRLAQFTVHAQGASLSDLLTKITAPNGELIPAELVAQHDGDYKVEWTPSISGRYNIDVLFGNNQIDGSPFTVDVFDVNRILIDDVHSSTINEKAGCTVDYSKAGRAEHHINILSPSGEPVTFEIRENNCKNEITYIPTISGKYKIYITYGGVDIPGTPIVQEVGEGEMPTAHGDGLYKGEEDKPATFYVDSARLKGDLFVQVDGPNSIAKCNIDPETDGTYTVTYIPVEVGLYDALVKWNGREIQGSPFHPKIVDARKVRVVGGWQHFMDSNDRVHLIVNEEKRIPFDTSEAGPGKLTAEIRDPHNAKIPVHIDTSSDGKNILVFTPKVEGAHLINVYWTEHPLVGAPFLGHAVSKQVIPTPDASKIILSGKGLKEAIVREEAEFRIDGSEAVPGKPEVHLTGVRTDIDVKITPLSDGRYQCKYMPIIPGAYLLNITWNDRQLKGSPFKVTVIAAPQPQKVMVTGDGLDGGIIGKDLQLDIDTRKAGPGELTAHCSGPTRIAYCELIDNHDGIYNLTVRPHEAGRHILQIKFGGEHVLGSPYVLKIGSLPDASKVRVSGPGVEHGILATYQSKFLVETRGAGAGQLTVRIKGPKGAFQVEMYRDNQKDRNIICRYNPYETGLYIIHVKWSGVDIPGSPFQVHIVDTQQDFEAILQETSPLHHNGYTYTDPLHQRLPYSQWREDI